MTIAVIAAGADRDDRVRHLAREALRQAGQGILVDVADLDPAALLGRVTHPSVADAVALVCEVPLVALATVAERGQVDTGLLLFLERLPPGALLGRPVVAAAAGDEHSYFAVDALRGAVAGLGGWLAGTLTYLSPGEGSDTGELPEVRRMELSTSLDAASRLRLLAAPRRW